MKVRRRQGSQRPALSPCLDARPCPVFLPLSLSLSLSVLHFSHLGLSPRERERKSSLWCVLGEGENRYPSRFGHATADWSMRKSMRPPPRQFLGDFAAAPAAADAAAAAAASSCCINGEELNVCSGIGQSHCMAERMQPNRFSCTAACMIVNLFSLPVQAENPFSRLASPRLIWAQFARSLARSVVSIDDDDDDGDDPL